MCKRKVIAARKRGSDQCSEFVLAAGVVLQCKWFNAGMDLITH